MGRVRGTAVSAGQLDVLQYLLFKSPLPIRGRVDFSNAASVAVSEDNKEALHLLSLANKEWRRRPFDFVEMACEAVLNHSFEVLKYIVEDIPKLGGPTVDIRPPSGRHEAPAYFVARDPSLAAGVRNSSLSA